MKLDINDIDRMIDVNNLEECTSPHLFSNKMTYDPDGILSNEIFGISKGDRRNTFAYVSLGRHYIHPHVYDKILCPLFSGFKYIMSGQKYYSVKNGILIEDEDNGWTGIDELYNHWDEIDWKHFKADSANLTNRKFVSIASKDKIFTDKWIIIPPAYRDVALAGTYDSSDHVDEVNNMYVKLMRLVISSTEGGVFSSRLYATQSKIEDTLVEIINYFKGLISKKTGLIRKNLMGKSVDYGVRTVISAPTYENDRFEDHMVDMDHCALPISECCSTFYPFIEAWLLNFFTREVINDPNAFAYYDPQNQKEIAGTIQDPELQFSERVIRKIINNYVLNPDNRFEVIKVKIKMTNKTAKPVDANLILKGKIILPNNTQQVLNRAMTYTDLLYLACVETCEHRHVMVSRYPVGTDKGIYFNKIRVQSTRKHMNVIFNGKEYKYYPVIDFKVPHEKVGVQFVDTLVYSNSHLDGMGADYDGDQVSVRGIWSDEANLEAEQIMKSKMAVLNITGTNSKVVAKELNSSIYELTKEGPTSAKPVKPADVEYLLNVKPNDITLSYLTSIFADTVDSSGKNVAGKRKSKYNTWDTITIPANQLYQGQSEIHTTIGRFIFNKFILLGSGIIEVSKYHNEVLNKGKLGDLDNAIGRFLMDDLITHEQFNSYIDHRDTLGYWLNGMLAHTMSEKMLKPLPEIEKKKAELCKKYEKELAAGDIDVMTKISDELCAYAKELLKGDPGMDMYDSGELDFSNNYKNNCIIKGAVMNNITKEFDFIDTSFMDGINIKDIPAHANSILASQYPASIATADSGYKGKKILALLQMMDVDEEGTDCGTKQLIPVTVTNANHKDLVYSYIQEGDGLIMLDFDNIKSYIGKTVMMRSPMTCINPVICSKCAGALFYKLGIKHAGLYATQLTHSELNLALKAKHCSIIELYTMDPNRLIENL